VVESSALATENPEAEKAAQAELLRDVFGPDKETVTFDTQWLTPTVRALASRIYSGRLFDELPKLADALFDAGCRDETVITHCRGTGPHVRGCWVLDSVLGKN